MQTWNEIGFPLIVRLSELSSWIILMALGLHLVLYAALFRWARRDLRGIAQALDEFTQDLRNRSLFGTTRHLSEQIDALVADVREVIDDPSRHGDAAVLLQRIRVLDERRGYFASLWFETCYSIGRNMIEAYPVAGVLGT